jgi:hypothetical protein
MHDQGGNDTIFIDKYYFFNIGLGVKLQYDISERVSFCSRTEFWTTYIKTNYDTQLSINESNINKIRSPSETNFNKINRNYTRLSINKTYSLVYNIINKKKITFYTTIGLAFNYTLYSKSKTLQHPLKDSYNSTLPYYWYQIDTTTTETIIRPYYGRKLSIIPLFSLGLEKKCNNSHSCSIEPFMSFNPFGDVKYGVFMGYSI